MIVNIRYANKKVQALTVDGAPFAIVEAHLTYQITTIENALPSVGPWELVVVHPSDSTLSGIHMFQANLDDGIWSAEGELITSSTVGSGNPREVQSIVHPL